MRPSQQCLSFWAGGVPPPLCPPAAGEIRVMDQHVSQLGISVQFHTQMQPLRCALMLGKAAFQILTRIQWHVKVRQKCGSLELFEAPIELI